MPTAPTRIKVIPRAISELNKAAVEEQTILQDYQRQKIYFATHALEIYFCRYSKARADAFLASARAVMEFYLATSLVERRLLSLTRSH